MHSSFKPSHKFLSHYHFVMERASGLHSLRYFNFILTSIFWLDESKNLWLHCKFNHLLVRRRESRTFASLSRRKSFDEARSTLSCATITLLPDEAIWEWWSSFQDTLRNWAKFHWENENNACMDVSGLFPWSDCKKRCAKIIAWIVCGQRPLMSPENLYPDQTSSPDNRSAPSPSTHL